MKRYAYGALVALVAALLLFTTGGPWAQQPSAPAPAAGGEVKPEAKPAEQPSEKKPDGAAPVTIKLDKTTLDNGGAIQVTGSTAPGKPVYLEVWADDKVRASRFDSRSRQGHGQETIHSLYDL
ncbi:MAG: hypothetical protein AB9873_11925 [Syntrophobacteraceae bacterium]